MNDVIATTTLEAPIRPAEGLGGLVLRANVSDLRTILNQARRSADFRMGLDSPLVARYSFYDGALEVWVDVRNGKIYQLTAGRGYRGHLFEKIGVGMTVAEAQHSEPRLFYDDFDEMMLCRGVSGVGMNLPQVRLEPGDLGGVSIESISVWVPEAVDTPRGQRGEW